MAALGVMIEDYKTFLDFRHITITYKTSLLTVNRLLPPPPSLLENLPNSCSPLPNTDFVQLTTTARAVGTVVTFTCQPGYILVGFQSIMCAQRSGSSPMWNGPPPMCYGRTTNLYIGSRQVYNYCLFPDLSSSDQKNGIALLRVK